MASRSAGTSGPASAHTTVSLSTTYMPGQCLHSILAHLRNCNALGLINILYRFTLVALVGVSSGGTADAAAWRTCAAWRQVALPQEPDSGRPHLPAADAAGAGLNVVVDSQAVYIQQEVC